jgi:transcriptional antiterminator
MIVLPTMSLCHSTPPPSLTSGEAGMLVIFFYGALRRNLAKKMRAWGSVGLPALQPTDE